MPRPCILCCHVYGRPPARAAHLACLALAVGPPVAVALYEVVIGRRRPSLDSRLTREHFTLTLGETWHRVYRNTERESWGQNGRVD